MMLGLIGNVRKSIDKGYCQLKPPLLLTGGFNGANCKSVDVTQRVGWHTRNLLPI